MLYVHHTQLILGTLGVRGGGEEVPFVMSASRAKLQVADGGEKENRGAWNKFVAISLAVHSRIILIRSPSQ